MSKTKMWVGVISLLLVGMVIGGFAGAFIERNRITDEFEQIRRGKRGPFIDDFLARLTRQLDLTKEQRVRLRPVLKKGLDRMHALHDRLRPEIDKVFKLNELELKEQLTEAQQKKLDEMFRRRPPRGGGPPFPPPDRGPGGPPSPDKP